MKSLFLLLLMCGSANVFSSQALNALKIKKENLRNSSELGKLKLYHSDKEGFSVKKQDGTVALIHRHDIDPALRGKASALIEAFCNNGGFISLHKMDNGDLSLKGHVRGLGGGPVGATVGCYTGKFLVHLVGHSVIAAVAFCSGPGAAPVAASLEATFLPTIEAASNVAAIAGGILGGVLTGPA